METEVVRIDAEKKIKAQDTITEEVFLTVHLNDRMLLTLSCTPGYEKELSVGFLFSSGLIHSLDEIELIFINTKAMSSHISLKDKTIDADMLFDRVYTSGCGRGVLYYNVLDLAHRKVITSDMRIQSDTITALMKSFEKRSVVFKRTGGVHSAALSDGREILVFSEDIGRHNALDKVIGMALYQHITMEDAIVLTSGRVSSEIMYKIQKMGSPCIVSRSAPTSLSVELAKKWNVTLVGFARGRKMNVYTAQERIV